MAERRLPEPFQDLEPYLAWALATERERSAKRRTSTMAEIKPFYEAMMARMEEILPYLAQFSPEDGPQDVQRLLYLTFSLAEVAPAVEMYGEPTVEGLDAARLTPVNIYPTQR
ncbi:MAG: hypothetical protein ACRERD_28915 [Candidatus Binatia bacterium]